MESLFERLDLFGGLFEQLQEVGLTLGLNIGIAIALFFCRVLWAKRNAPNWYSYSADNNQPKLAMIKEG